MPAALTPPLDLAAIVLCIAGVAKLRAPAGAVRALAVLGGPASASLVRLFAFFELGLGLWCLLAAGRVAAALLACVYAGFGAISYLLARRRESCGCFGEREAPASAAQSALSACLSLTGLCAAIWPAHHVTWLLERAMPGAIVAVLGITGAAYAAVVVYTELPHAWSAWTPGAK